MPRKRLARRFVEPRGGVSQSMLEVECRYLAREFEDHLVFSITDLRERLAGLQKMLANSEENLQRALSSMPDRERLALRAVLARDMVHIAALFETFLRSPQAPDATGTVDLKPEEITTADEPRPALPFSELLFEG